MYENTANQSFGRWNMKKTITKILAATASVISFILILILVILAFKGLKPEEIQKGLGKGLIIAL